MSKEPRYATPSRVVIINDNKLGSRPVFVKADPGVPKVSQPPPRRRVFPIEGKTETPNATSYRPKAYNDHEAPSLKNGYRNDYPSSAAQMSIRYHEGTVSNLV